MRRWGAGPDRPTTWEVELDAAISFLEEQVGDLRVLIATTPREELASPRMRAVYERMFRATVDLSVLWVLVSTGVQP